MPLLDHSEFDPNKPLRGGQKCTIPGKCALKVLSANHKEGKKGPYYAVTFEVVAHEKEEAVGLEYFQIFPMSGTAAKGTLQLALATGTITLEELQDSALTGKGGIEFDLRLATDCLVFGEITKGEWQGKDTYKVWDVYGPDEPESAEYPHPKPAGSDVQDEDQTGVPVVETDDTTDDDDSDDIPF